ncbi:MAG: alpha/beta fold hydrolase [Desulfobacterales bacterium]|nr:alpha/beta fold hydrolase [Desulfobacterales bacterium]
MNQIGVLRKQFYTIALLTIACFFMCIGCSPWYQKYGFETEAQLKEKSAIPTLIRALQKKDWKTRKDAARALSEFGPEAKGALSILMAELQERYPLAYEDLVRCELIRCIGQIGPEAKEALPIIMSFLNAPSFQIRNEAMIALGKIRPEANTEHLALRMLTAAHDTNRSVRKSAMNTWNEIGLSPIEEAFSVSLGNSPSGNDYDLILIHGLSNYYSWSDSFLSKCLDIFGSGNVYVIYLTPLDIAWPSVWEREVNGKKIICAGDNNYKAGTKYIDVLSESMHQSIRRLQKFYGLSDKFKIIAHSYGGLVSRYYIYNHPYTVASLVTLGTPHHGSPLAFLYYMASYITDSTEAFAHLEPRFVEDFNKKFPVRNAPLADKGKIYTIRGDCDLWDCYTLFFELIAGWEALYFVYFTDSDGIVPTNSSVIDGAEHIADFWDYDHRDLVKRPEVAEKACQYLH